MIYTWKIYVNGEYKGDVRSITEYHARNWYYMKQGGASRYSGVGMQHITAVKKG